MSKKAQPKKVFLRNVQDNTANVAPSSSKHLKPMKTNLKQPVSKEGCYSLPTLNSTLNLVRKVDNVKKVKPNCSQELASKTAHSVADITKKVNFPFDENIYKDLISLRITGPEKSTKPYKQYIRNTKTQINEDSEPTLETINPRNYRNTDYKINVACPELLNKTSRHEDAFKLYKLLYCK